jgi:hypothetical protein
MVALKSSGKKIHCIADVAASMAFVIFQACDTRLIVENSILMQHVPSLSLGGPLPNVITSVGLMTDIADKLEKDQANRLKMPLEEFRRKTRNDWWLFDKSAILYGAADEMVVASCSLEMIEDTYETVVNVIFFTVNVTWSKCPQITDPISIEVDGGYTMPKVPDMTSILEKYNARKCVKDDCLRKK